VAGVLAGEHTRPVCGYEGQVNVRPETSCLPGR
jgi:hypothetical protein